MMMELMTMAQPAAAAAEVAAAGVSGSLTLGLAGAGAALGIGLIGGKAVEAVGRNPGAAGSIQTLAIIGMALAEAVAIYALIIAFQGR
ncbi:F-type H+-transporting ATPase subunit c [Prosthecobacter debontii]|uniref:ATP synthase subunit c n=1 Tax=Prosthecobacter debontii TaxID=48467 RepID=A0A1T4XGF3_9BACT|nr:ATP synthase F0 subunit C [Prosthecobacter debontii]SKA88589.1 F-type H+-transporting ATPase subunit c [Prosthecobacter debontii]